MARQIEAYKLRTELAVDAARGRAEMQKFQKNVDDVGKSFEKLGPKIDASLKGKDIGAKFGSGFAASATSIITSSFDSLGQSLGSMIGTAIAPGVGTAIGSIVGSGVDAATSKLTGVMIPLIQRGMQLNKSMKQTVLEFKHFTGSTEQATKFLEDLKEMAIDTGEEFLFLKDTNEELLDLTGNLELANKIMKASVEQAADFGGGAATIKKVAEALGLMAEKGELGSRELQKLYRVGIDAKKYLAEATGRSEKQIDALIKSGRVRGEVAARLIAEGVAREKRGFAKRLGEETMGPERLQQVLNLTAAKATVNLEKTQQELATKGVDLLRGPGAQDLADYINDLTGRLVDLSKQGIDTGINVTKGVATGIADGFSAVGESITDLSNYVLKQFDAVFQMKSPSKLTENEVGVPIGQGIARGIGPGFISEFNKSGGPRDQIMSELSGLIPSATAGGGTVRGGGLRSAAQSLMQLPHVQALLETVKWGEGGQRNVMFGGRVVESGAAHPGEVVPFSQWKRGDKGRSSASGFYQITRTNWRDLAPALGLTNFSDPEQQKLAAIGLMLKNRAGAFDILRGGDVRSMMGLTALDWTSTPGSKIGGGKQKNRQEWLAHYSQNFAAMTGGAWLGGAPVSPTIAGAVAPTNRPVGSVPVVVTDIQGAAKTIFGAPPETGLRGRGPGYAAVGRELPGVLDVASNAPFSVMQNMGEMTVALQEADGAIVNVTYASEELIKTNLEHEKQLVRMSKIIPKAMQPIEDANVKASALQQDALNSTKKLTEQAQDLAWKQLQFGESMLDKFGSALSQITGFIPSQTGQVSKKRGLFSKILGIAAPFLSFIPGVGPILSTVAGMASSAIGGDYAGAVTRGITGIQSGGVFRSSGGGGKTTTTGGGGFEGTKGGDGFNLEGKRQYGGPVYAGQSYVVGEGGRETFTPRVDGYITPGVSGDPLLAVAAELRAAVQHLHTMPANQVVMRGARGLVRAMDHDAGLIRLVSQRQRLA